MDRQSQHRTLRATTTKVLADDDDEDDDDDDDDYYYYYDDEDDDSNEAVVWKDTKTEFLFSLSTASRKHIVQCLDDTYSLNNVDQGRDHHRVGAPSFGTGTAASRTLPTSLARSTRYCPTCPFGACPSSRLTSPSVPKAGYYVAFQDGRFSNCPNSLDRELENLEHPPLSVAFGLMWVRWFVVRHDGSWNCRGRIPPKRWDTLAARNFRDDLVLVSLGPSGE